MAQRSSNDLTADHVATAVTECGFRVVDRIELPARRPRYRAVPESLEPTLRSLLISQYPRGLCQHQADAIEAALKRDNVCVATSTASGKSLAFMAATANLLLCDPEAKVLALYPARALIQDQLRKWRAILEPLNLPLGYIDGDVRVDARSEILDTSRVVLMTPDVVL